MENENMNSIMEEAMEITEIESAGKNSSGVSTLIGAGIGAVAVGLCIGACKLGKKIVAKIKAKKEEKTYSEINVDYTDLDVE